MQYCVDVLEDKILTGELIKLACKRHLNDLWRIQNDSEFHYTYSTQRAQGMLNFSELVPDVSSGKPMKLARFQIFLLSMLEGWRDTRTDGSRFKFSYVSMARTNGKTQLSSYLALHDFLLGTPATSRQVVIASNNNDQVRQLYGYIRLAWKKLSETKWFSSFKNAVTDNFNEMRIQEQNTRLIKLSAESLGGDSIHATTLIFDEFHLQKDNEFMNTLTSGNIQNPDSKVIIISTAGTNPNAPMREQYTSYSEALRKGNLNDQTLFLCWEQDTDEEAFKPDTWIKSNPLMELPVMQKNLSAGLFTEREQQIAEGTLPQFQVKNMNRWQNAQKNAYIPLDLIDSSIIKDFDLRDRDVYLGMDLSLNNDDTSLAALIPYENGKFFIWQHSFIPTRIAGSIEAKEKQDQINYREAEREGYATVTTSRFGTINQDQVFRYMLEIVDKYHWNILGFGYDAWNAGSFVRSLEDLHSDDWKLFPIRQGARSLSEPTKWLQDAFNDHKIKMYDDRVLRAGLSNAIIDAKDNQMLIDKNIGSKKIDMVDALIDACYQGMWHFTGYTNEQIDKKSPFAGMSNQEINDHFKNDFSFG